MTPINIQSKRGDSEGACDTAQCRVNEGMEGSHSDRAYVRRFTFGPSILWGGMNHYEDCCFSVPVSALPLVQRASWYCRAAVILGMTHWNTRRVPHKRYVLCVPLNTSTWRRRERGRERQRVGGGVREGENERKNTRNVHGSGDVYSTLRSRWSLLWTGFSCGMKRECWVLVSWVVIEVTEPCLFGHSFLFC